MFKRSSIFALSVLALALSTAHADIAAAQTGWTARCGDRMAGCDAASTQCDLDLSVFRFATTEGHWVGILGVPAGWDRLVVQVAKGNETSSTTIKAPQLPRMAFGDEALKNLLLAGTSAVIEIFQTDRLLKSCKFDLSGLADTYKRLK